MKNSYRKPVRYLFFLLIPLSSLIYGCAQGPGGFDYKIAGADAPVIEQAIAAETISSGTTWRLYLWATDPNGDIASLTYAVEQPGATAYSPGHMTLRPAPDGKLQGYLYLDTPSMAFASGWQMWFTVRVSVEDATGNRSLPRVFTVYFNGKTSDDIRQWEKAQLASMGLEEPRLLGRIHTELRPVGETVGPGFSEPVP